MTRFTCIHALLLAAIAPGGLAYGQAYPVKAVRMLVPFPPGGGTDYTARLIGQKLSELWGQPMVVENRPGASTTIASEIVARAAPDGYTLIMASVNHTINPSLYAKIPYDTIKDFAPVTVAVTAAYVLVVHPSLPVKSVKELIELARAKPGQINYSSSGSSGPQHLAGELFKLRTPLIIGLQKRGCQIHNAFAMFCRFSARFHLKLAPFTGVSRLLCHSGRTSPVRVACRQRSLRFTLEQLS